jgi:hypothetical protein
MNYTNIRDALVTYVATDWAANQSSVPLFFENTVQIDLDDVGDIFVACEIDFTDTVQADLGPGASSRIEGEVMFRVFTKEGTGTRVGLGLWDYLEPLLQRRVISSIVMETATPGRKMSKNGWTSMELFVPFHCYSFY